MKKVFILCALIASISACDKNKSTSTPTADTVGDATASEVLAADVTAVDVTEDATAVTTADASSPTD